MWIKTRSGALVNAGPGSVIISDVRPGGQRLYVKYGDHESDIAFFPTNPGVPSRLPEGYDRLWQAIKLNEPWFEVDFGEITPPYAPERISHASGGSR